jgi:hypothetical protein
MAVPGASFGFWRSLCLDLPVYFGNFAPFFQEIAQGIVNLMVVCYTSEDYSDAVVVRVFGNLLASVVNRDQEVKVNKLLSEIGLGAPLLAIFKNGLCSGFIKGRGFSWKDAADFRDIGLAK